MKKILKYSAIAALCLAAVSLTGCKHEEYDTDQYAGAVALSAVAPNPVMRGGQLRILGTNLPAGAGHVFRSVAVICGVKENAALGSAF